MDAVLTEVAFLLHDDGVVFAHCIGQRGIEVVIQGRMSVTVLDDILGGGVVEIGPLSSGDDNKDLIAPCVEVVRVVSSARGKTFLVGVFFLAVILLCNCTKKISAVWALMDLMSCAI